MLQSFLILQRIGTQKFNSHKPSSVSHPLPWCWAKPAIPLHSLSHQDNGKSDYCLGWLGKREKKKKKSNAKKKLKPEKLSQGVCTNTACVSKAVPSISNLPEEHPQAAAGTASAQLLLPHQGDSRPEPSSSVPWDEQCSAPPCPNSHSAELTAASWQETWVVFFFPSFYSSPPG